MGRRYGGDSHGDVETGALGNVDDSESKHGEHAAGGRFILDDEALGGDLRRRGQQQAEINEEPTR